MRMKKTLVVAAIVAALALSATAPVAGESHEEAAPPQPIIWVSLLKAPPGGSQTLIGHIKEQGEDLYGQLLADGKIFEWGIAQPINHHRDNNPYDVAEWATFADWAAVDAFVAGFLARQAAMSPEERAANQKAYQSAVVAGSHYDAVHQAIHAATDGDRPGYLVIGFHKARPGKGAGLTQMWQSHARPVYEKLLADGKIKGFGLFTQALHGDHTWTHGTWATVAGLAGVGDINKAFEKAMDEERMAQMMETVDWESHWDDILAVVHYQNASGE